MVLPKNHQYFFIIGNYILIHLKKLVGSDNAGHFLAFYLYGLGAVVDEGVSGLYFYYVHFVVQFGVGCELQVFSVERFVLVFGFGRVGNRYLFLYEGEVGE